MTDAEAISAALAGDQDAYGLLFKRLGPIVRKSRGKYFRDSAAGVDFEADCLAHILLRLHMWDGMAKFSTWATRVAINFALGQLRSSKTRTSLTVSLEDPIGEEGGSTVGDGIAAIAKDETAAWEAKQDLDVLLAGLSDLQRTVLVMAKLQGMSMEEIAAAIGKPITAVKSLVHHAMGKAREMAEEIMEEQQSNGVARTPSSFSTRICVCGCKESFVPNGPRQIFVLGHRMPVAAVKPRQYKKRDAPGIAKTAQPVTPSVPAPAPAGEVEMVTLTVPATAIDALLRLLPTRMKADAVAQILVSLETL